MPASLAPMLPGMGREPGLGRGEVRTCGQVFKGGGWAPSLSQVRWNPQAPRGSSRFLLFLVLYLSLTVSVHLCVCLCLFVSLHLSSLSLSVSLPVTPSPPPHHLQAHLCPRSPGGLLGGSCPIVHRARPSTYPLSRHQGAIPVPPRECA